MAPDVQHFSTAVAHLMAAEVQDKTMRDEALPRSARDRATQAYCRSVDSLVAELAELRRRGVLRRLVGFLQDQDGEANTGEMIVVAAALGLYFWIAFSLGFGSKYALLLLTAGCN